ncbi:MAG TPA: segregation/condensation protein A, partial [Nitrospiria bacterium]
MTVANETISQPEVKEEKTTSYSIKLPHFEGPMDLLLHLIKKNEMNITDIPISSITRQYLGYLDLMKALNLSTVGEFLVMAATLIHIKSKMLLPPSETEEEEEEAGDPRAELVRRLLEYQQFKDAAQKLAHRENEWRDVFDRDPVEATGGPPDEVNLV